MRRTGLTLASIAAAALLLAGCGGNESQQRAAFIQFLQTRILDKPGIHLPRLTDDERSQFGPYADQFEIITQFNKTMDESVSPKMSAAVQAGAISSVGDVVNNVGRLQTAKAGIDAMDKALTADVAQADAAHAKLNQPADLKPVYDKAYSRLVTEPAAAFKDIVPVMDAVLDKAIDLGQYLDQHRDSVRVSGSLIETNDAAVRAAVNEKLEAIQASQRAVQAAQSRMQSVMYGSAQ